MTRNENTGALFYINENVQKLISVLQNIKTNTINKSKVCT